MANEGKITYIPGLLAGVDLSANQFKAVAHASTAGEVIASVAASTIIGIQQNDPTDGQAASIAGPGSISIAYAATSTISAADYLIPNSTGFVGTSVKGHITIVAEEASGAVGDLIMAAIH